ncbi:hypothetical protein OG933_43900 [Streptomyces sp. NBC_00016]|uniref:hypothetical protein n=1 Tax=Streptomyces sp. NBC_00016 TaxID=2975622 RepID=UPI003249E9FC
MLATADDVRRRLNRMYGVLKRLDGKIPPHREDESLEEARPQIEGIWDQLSDMRRVMRQSIGITANDPSGT